MVKVKIALISVYNKKGIEDFAQRLVALGWKILASCGTAKCLIAAGIPVTDVAEWVGGGAILGHRVVTLSREVSAGLLCTDTPEDVAEMKRLGLSRIGLVCCDFYPLEEEIAKPKSTRASVIEKIDIGGPNMVRSAAKGGRIVICDPVDRQMVIEQLEATGDVDEKTCQHLGAKAEFVAASYSLAATRYLSKGEFDGIIGQKVFQLGKGENLDQSPAFGYSDGGNDPLAWDKFKVISGNPGYINMADGDRTLLLLRFLAESFRRNFQGKVPYIAIVCKHGNPTGTAIDWEDPKIALTKALLGDPIAGMGGEVMTNFPITGELAEALYEVPEELRAKVGRDFWGVDVVFAPGFDEAATELLGKKERRSLLANSALANPTMPKEKLAKRPNCGGFLEQMAPNYVFEAKLVKKWTCQKSLKPNDLASLIIAWAVTWFASSNTVALAKDNMLIALGCGQQDRIFCVVICLMRAERAGHDTKGAWFASDAFFPYATHIGDGPLEGPELLIQAGCIGGVVPADGKKLPDVIKLFADNGLVVAFLPAEHRGFFDH